MKKYKLAIWEEISGYIDVEAKSQEEAEQIAFFLMDEHGCEKLLCADIRRDGSHLIKYNGDHTHRRTEVLECVERTNSGEYKNL